MADVVKSLYERWGEAFAAEPEMSLDQWRAMVEEWPQVTGEPGGVDYVELEAGGVPAMWITPKGAAEDRVILSIHGGGFVVGSMYTHRKLFGHLAKTVGAVRSRPITAGPPSTCTRPRSRTWFPRTSGCSTKGSRRRTSRSPATRRAEGWS